MHDTSIVDISFLALCKCPLAISGAMNTSMKKLQLSQAVALCQNFDWPSQAIVFSSLLEEAESILAIQSLDTPFAKHRPPSDFQLRNLYMV
jgi:hypothetical protein